MSLNVIGISAYYHDSACCLLKSGKLVAAAQEERFSHIKHDNSLPSKAFAYCLEAAGLSITDIDCIAYYENPVEKLSRQLWSLSFARQDQHVVEGLDPLRPERELREVLGYEGEVITGKHHQSHAASSFFFSGFSEAAILTMDGVGEWATTTYGSGGNGMIEIFEEVAFPHSLGLLYSAITSYLGFGVNDGEYKVMGLAPYGKPQYADKIFDLITVGKNGQYALNMEYFAFLENRKMYSGKLCDLFGQPARQVTQPITQFTCDVARSLQHVLEEVVLEKVRYLHRRTQAENLCLAGGVALNCVLNLRIQR